MNMTRISVLSPDGGQYENLEEPLSLISSCGTRRPEDREGKLLKILLVNGLMKID